MVPEHALQTPVLLAVSRSVAIPTKKDAGAIAKGNYPPLMELLCPF